MLSLARAHSCVSALLCICVVVRVCAESVCVLGVRGVAVSFACTVCLWCVWSGAVVLARLVATDESRLCDPHLCVCVYALGRADRST